MKRSIRSAMAAAALGPLLACNGSIGGGHTGTGNSAGTATGTAGATGSGTAGATGSGGSGVSTGTGGTQAPPFEAVQAAVAVRKVKNLLIGMPATDADVATATTMGRAGMQALINSWMTDAATTPLFRDKMVAFFRNTFQQVGFSPLEDFKPQLLTNGGFDFGPFGLGAVGDDSFYRLVQNLQDSFALTAWGLVAEGKPFTDVLSTTRFQMTTGLKSLYVQTEMPADAPFGNASAVPAWTIDFSKTAIPLETALTSMTFSDEAPTVTTGFGGNNSTCSAVPTGTYNGTSLLFQRLVGFTPRFPFSGNPTCFEHAAKPYLTVADTQDWGWVTINHKTTPTDRAAAIQPYNLPALRTATALTLSLPRVGFYTTPAYLAIWNTNDSNQHRVTANQTLLIALGQSFTSANAITPFSTTGLDNAHSVSGSECLACHQGLDPLRQFWATQYDFNDRNDFPARASFNGASANPRPGTIGGVLAFGTVNIPGNDIYALGPLLAQVDDVSVPSAPVSRFAIAMTQQLCYFASSAACLESDAEFRRVALAFQSSNFDFPTLIRELLSSPLVTHTSMTATTQQNGVTISISRRDQLCAALSNRLGVADLCALAVPLPSSAQNATLKITSSVAGDAFSRGSEIPVAPSDPNLFYRAATEMLCENIAPRVVDPTSGTNVFPSADVPASVEKLVSLVIGYPPADAHHAMAVAILTNHFNTARMSPNSATAANAMRSTFAAACQSPTGLSFGL